MLKRGMTKEQLDREVELYLFRLQAFGFSREQMEDMASHGGLGTLQKVVNQCALLEAQKRKPSPDDMVDQVRQSGGAEALGNAPLQHPARPAQPNQVQVWFHRLTGHGFSRKQMEDMVRRGDPDVLQVVANYYGILKQHRYSHDEIFKMACEPGGVQKLQNARLRPLGEEDERLRAQKEQKKQYYYRILEFGFDEKQMIAMASRGEPNVLQAVVNCCALFPGNVPQDARDAIFNMACEPGGVQKLQNTRPHDLEAEAPRVRVQKEQIETHRHILEAFGFNKEQMENMVRSGGPNVLQQVLNQCGLFIYERGFSTDHIYKLACSRAPKAFELVSQYYQKLIIENEFSRDQIIDLACSGTPKEFELMSVYGSQLIGKGQSRDKIIEIVKGLAKGQRAKGY